MDRPRIVPNVNKPLINAASMTTSFNGPAVNIQGMPGASFDITWSGAPVGTLGIEVSNSYFPDSEGNPNASGSWSTIPLTSFSGNYPVPAGTPGNGFIDVLGTEAAWVRLVYTATSGTGTLTVLVSAKVL